jgi:hypothetical protein
VAAPEKPRNPLGDGSPSHVQDPAAEARRAAERAQLPPQSNEKPRTITEANIDAAQSVMHRYRQGARAPGVKVVMPGGLIHDATPYLESKMKMGRHATAYADVDKWLTPEWEADHPGYQYAWPRFTDPFLQSRLRDHSYVYVPATALRDGCPIPYTETVGTKGEEAIQITDTVCVAVSPEAWDRLFRSKEAMGVAAVVGNAEAFYAGVDQEGGQAEMWTGGSHRGPTR